MLKAIRTNNDLRVGMVLTTKSGSNYVVVADDNGHHDVINLGTGKSNGIEVGTGRIAVTGGNTVGSRNVVKIEEFDAIPTRNRLSEALKIMTGKPFTEELVTVWTAERPEIVKAKERIANAEAELKAARADLARIQ